MNPAILRSTILMRSASLLIPAFLMPGSLWVKRLRSLRPRANGLTSWDFSTQTMNSCLSVLKVVWIPKRLWYVSMPLARRSPRKRWSLLIMRRSIEVRHLLNGYPSGRRRDCSSSFYPNILLNSISSRFCGAL